MRQFAAQAREASVGFHTPRSSGGRQGFDEAGYPVSPGGTSIRPPPGPPPMSPRGPPAPIPSWGAGQGIMGFQGFPCGFGYGPFGKGGAVGEVPVSGAGWPEVPGAPTCGVWGPGLPGAAGVEGSGVQGNVTSDHRPEEPAKYIVDLPRLVQSDLSTSAVVCGNWLAQVRQIFQGLSPSADIWFSSVEAAANQGYQRWLVADPLGRLAIDPSMVIAQFDVHRFQRVESRAVTLLLSALPASVKDDIVMNRWLSSASILFRISLYLATGRQ